MAASTDAPAASLDDRSMISSHKKDGNSRLIRSRHIRILDQRLTAPAVGRTAYEKGPRRGIIRMIYAVVFAGTGVPVPLAGCPRRPKPRRRSAAYAAPASRIPTPSCTGQGGSREGARSRVDSIALPRARPDANRPSLAAIARVPHDASRDRSLRRPGHGTEQRVGRRAGPRHRRFRRRLHRPCAFRRRQHPATPSRRRCRCWPRPGGGWPVVHTRVVYAEDGADAGGFTRKVPGLRKLTEASPLSQIVPELTPAPGE